MVPVWVTVLVALGAMVAGMALVAFAVRCAVREILVRALNSGSVRDAMERHPSGQNRRGRGSVFRQRDSGDSGGDL